MTGFLLAEKWLGGRSVEGFEALRRTGANVGLLVDFWMNQDQVEMVLPPSLLLRAGERGLGIHLISND